jgi:hypothetical protein
MGELGLQGIAVGNGSIMLISQIFGLQYNGKRFFSEVFTGIESVGEVNGQGLSGAKGGDV